MEYSDDFQSVLITLQIGFRRLNDYLIQQIKKQVLPTIDKYIIHNRLYWLMYMYRSRGYHAVDVCTALIYSVSTHFS